MGVKKSLGRVVHAHLPVTRFLFDQIRLEINAEATTLMNALLPSHRRELRRLRSSTNLYANVACGPFPISGFVNLDLFSRGRDVVAVDCRRRLPFTDETVVGIRVEHFVEHLERCEELPAFLTDCLRTLQAGGVLRIIVPDAERFLNAYCSGGYDRFAELGYTLPFPGNLRTRMDVVNYVFHQAHEHRWGYDYETLADRLSEAGFSQIARVAFREGARGGALSVHDREVHAPYSLYVEASK